MEPVSHWHRVDATANPLTQRHRLGAGAILPFVSSPCVLH